MESISWKSLDETKAASMYNRINWQLSKGQAQTSKKKKWSYGEKSKQDKDIMYTKINYVVEIEFQMVLEVMEQRLLICAHTWLETKYFPLAVCCSKPAMIWKHRIQSSQIEIRNRKLKYSRKIIHHNRCISWINVSQTDVLNGLLTET